MMYRLPLTRMFQRRLALAAIAPLTASTVLLFGSSGLSPTHPPAAIAQTEPSRPLTLRSDIQEANARTGVVTARGNVQIYYPARQIQATAAQAQYFSRERRIILSGDVYVLQQGNSLRGETITYLIDEGRFVALPKASRQVEAVYLLRENNTPEPTPVAAPSPIVPAAPPFGPSEFGSPTSVPNLNPVTPAR